MFKFVVVFAVVLSGMANAAEGPQQCLPEVVNTHQVLVTGEYGGKPFAYTITSQSKAKPGQQTANDQSQEKPCPLTS